MTFPDSYNFRRYPARDEAQRLLAMALLTPDSPELPRRADVPCDCGESDCVERFRVEVQ